MARAHWWGIRLAGLWAAVPPGTGTVADLAGRFGEADSQKIADSTGIIERRLATPDVCASDLCCQAAERLLDDLKWDRSSIDALIFVSQTPDTTLPATACSLQQRLALPTSCAAFDVSLGCSGYLYGLWLAGSLLKSGTATRVLLLVGDTISRLVNPADRATAPVFGDAGTATALEAAPDQTGSWTFDLGTDGSGGEHLIVPAGGFRRPSTAETRTATARDGGNVRSDEQLFMDGAEVFGFTQRVVPKLVNGVLTAAGKTITDVDYAVFHQANLMMLQFLARKMSVPPAKMPIGLRRFGNTTSPSIPLTMATELDVALRSAPRTLLLAGFGVGWSWGAAVIETQPLASIGLVEMEP
ncbi:MAG TPA: ketoacyl-ACP synthase III [Vicinamibacterales bacterium]|nr:ketoacyl-ACP synthase III [Vicinamibacterales bacterium]